MNVLAIGAHPDDIEIFMYGLLSEYKIKGHHVDLIVATDGSKGGDNKDSKLSKIRANETLRALKDLGVPYFLNFKDGELCNDSKHYLRLKNIIDKLKPNLILTHHKNDYHSDHTTLSDLVKRIACHYIPILYCDTMMGINFQPNYYVDITKHFNKKKKALMYHKTQNPKRFINLVELMNSYRAAQCNAPVGCYAEGYKFHQSFPFVDIREYLLKPIKILPFNIKSHHGFL